MTEVGGIAVDRLRSLIERIERLEEEKKAIAGDIRDIFAEAKSAGFDVKVMREIPKLRKMDAADRDEKDGPPVLEKERSAHLKPTPHTAPAPQPKTKHLQRNDHEF